MDSAKRITLTEDEKDAIKKYYYENLPKTDITEAITNEGQKNKIQDLLDRLNSSGNTFNYNKPTFEQISIIIANNAEMRKIKNNIINKLKQKEEEKIKEKEEEMQKTEEDKKTKEQEEKNEILKLPDNYITHCLKYDLIKSMQRKKYLRDFKHNTNLEVLSENFNLNNVDSIEFTLDMTGEPEDPVKLKIDNNYNHDLLTNISLYKYDLLNEFKLKEPHELTTEMRKELQDLAYPNENGVVFLDINDMDYIV